MQKSDGMFLLYHIGYQIVLFDMTCLSLHFLYLSCPFVGISSSGNDDRYALSVLMPVAKYHCFIRSRFLQQRKNMTYFH